MDLLGLKFFRCDADGRVQKHSAGLYMKSCLDVVEANVELPNVFMVNVFVVRLKVLTRIKGQDFISNSTPYNSCRVSLYSGLNR